MAHVVFWISAAFIFYVYVGYPLVLWVWRSLARKPVCKAGWEPSVSLVIAAHNEREHIQRKLRNCLALDYPGEKLEIVVSLDGSTDGTERLAREFASNGVIVISSAVHRGKAGALNRAL